jgi:chondroitin synthase
MLKTHSAPYGLASSGNIAYRRADAIEVGLHDEDFNRWGGEDDEFGYRMLRHGAYFIPETKGLAYHQDHPDAVDREEDRKISAQILARKVPHYRMASAAREWEAPKVSVYIPAYNAAKWIEAAIESALHQILKDLEVCICNDGSTDETLELLEERYGDHPRVRWTSQKNGGTPSASRRAVELCRGEYILQLDADDELLPEAAAVLAAELDRNTDIALVYAGRVNFGTQDGLLIPRRYSRYTHLVSNVVSHPRMFRARDYYRTSGFDDRYPSAEDFDLSLKLAERGEVRSTPRAAYRYRIHEQSASMTGADRQGRLHYRIIRDALGRLGLPWEMSPLDPACPGRVQLSHPRGLSSVGRSRLRAMTLAKIDKIKNALLRRSHRLAGRFRR